MGWENNFDIFDKNKCKEGLIFVNIYNLYTFVV